MKALDAITDDNGQRWEVEYESVLVEKMDPVTGAVVLGERGRPETTTEIWSFRYRKEGDTDWLTLPPWATVREDDAVTFCFFDEDDETEEMTFWPVSSAAAPVRVAS